ncbi:hypothetical protein Hte_009456 [Hypoxylon texense]
METPQEYYQTPGHVIAAGIVLSIVDIVALVLRFWTRKKQHEPLKMDDWLIIPATLLVVGIGVSMVYGVSRESLGYRTHVPSGFTGDIETAVTEQLQITDKIQWAFAMMLPLALGCIKASFLFFYMRIFSISKKSPINIFLSVLLVIVAAWSISFFFATLFACRLSFWAVWGSTVDLITQCIESMQLVLALCITDFMTDVIIICIPIPLVWRLNLTTTRKIAVSIVFLLGAVTIAASLTRLVIIARAVAIGFDSDATLVITENIYWGLVECAVGIFAACLPTLQFLLLKEVPWKSLKSLKSLFKARQSDETYTGIRDNPDLTATSRRPFRFASKSDQSVSTRPTLRATSSKSDRATLDSTEAFVLEDIRAGEALSMK